MVLVLYILAFVILPLILWLFSVGNVFDYLEDGVPVGQLLYILSKLAGLLAISLLTLQISLMSFRRLPLALRGLKSRPRWNIERHGILGTVTIICAVVHAGLFILAASARSDHWVWHLLAPRFQSGFYDAMVSLGVIAIYLLVIVGILGWYSRRRAYLRPIHQVVVVLSTALIIIHSFAIGSETHTLPLRLYYVALLAILAGSTYTLFRSKYSSVNHA